MVSFIASIKMHPKGGVLFASCLFIVTVGEHDVELRALIDGIHNAPNAIVNIRVSSAMHNEDIQWITSGKAPHGLTQAHR